MNKWTELKLLKKTLKEVLASDELETTLWYLDEFKKLKQKEFNEEDLKNIYMCLTKERNNIIGELHNKDCVNYNMFSKKEIEEMKNIIKQNNKLLKKLEKIMEE